MDITYQTRVANSEFTRTWTRRRWGFDCEVVYPPGDATIRPQPKKHHILSVGRFFMAGHQKRQLEMVRTFEQMRNGVVSADWEYLCAGGLDELDAEARAYFDGVTQAARGAPVHVLANVPRDRLRTLYGEAEIFWHAAGLGQDEAIAPERCEHFGMVTVEAMAAACVPVVIRKGGQPEIVEHGVSGFLWNTLDELQAYTRLLMANDELRQRMSAAAVIRAQRFSQARFETDMVRRMTS
jgi:glycosyltransferase involved in cell wall biosynthesis